MCYRLLNMLWHRKTAPRKLLLNMFLRLGSTKISSLLIRMALPVLMPTDLLAQHDHLVSFSVLSNLHLQLIAQFSNAQPGFSLAPLRWVLWSQPRFSLVPVPSTVTRHCWDGCTRQLFTSLAQDFLPQVSCPLVTQLRCLMETPLDWGRWQSSEGRD